METIKYEKHSSRLFAKPLFNIRDDSKEKGRVYRNNPNPKTEFFQRIFYSDTPLIWTLFMPPPPPPPVSVSTWFDLNSTEVRSSTVCDMKGYFHNLSFQSKGGVYRLLGVLHSVFFLVN